MNITIYIDVVLTLSTRARSDPIQWCELGMIARYSSMLYLHPGQLSRLINGHSGFGGMGSFDTCVWILAVPVCVCVYVLCMNVVCMCWKMRKAICFSSIWNHFLVICHLVLCTGYNHSCKIVLPWCPYKNARGRLNTNTWMKIKIRWVLS